METDAALPHVRMASDYRDRAVTKIEAIFESIADSILQDDPSLAIKLKTRNPGGRVFLDRDTQALRNRAALGERVVCFPGADKREAWRFTVLVRILSFMHEALVSDCVTTKRDIFYKDPELFFRQSVVDRYVDDIAHTFDVPRALLNVVAAAKGLVIGPLKLKRKDGSELNCGSQSEGTLIPNIDDLEPIQNLDVEWILVVEKEATFRSISGSRFWESSAVGKGIVLTAKGYPDLSSRAFLRFLTQPARPTNHDYHSKPAPTLPLPVFGLVDFDPDGLAILSTYKYGSHNMAHENAALNVPRMQWLGIRSHDLLAPRPGTDSYEGIQHQRPHYSSSASAHDGGSGILKLTARDRNRATKMLEWEILAQDGPETEWRRELQVMLVLNVKAEIQVLWEAEEGLLGWLERMLLMAS